MRHYRKYATGREVYPEISKILAPEYGEMPAEVVEEIVTRNFGESISAEDLEFSIGKFLKSAGKVAQNVLPAVAPIAGTVIGTAVGGPVGAAIGGQLGSLAGRAVAPGRPAQPGGIPPSPVGRMMPTTGGSPSAAQLLQMISRPEVLQALMGMMMGGAGRPNVMVGNTPVPAGAVANTIATLANQAAAEYNAVASGGEVVPRYLLDERGEFLCDPAVAEQRTEVLLRRFNEAAVQKHWERYESDYEYDEGDYEYDFEEELDDAMYDEMDIIDLYSED